MADSSSPSDESERGMSLGLELLWESVVLESLRNFLGREGSLEGGE